MSGARTSGAVLSISQRPRPMSAATADATEEAVRLARPPPQKCKVSSLKTNTFLATRSRYAASGKGAAIPLPGEARFYGLLGCHWADATEYLAGPSVEGAQAGLVVGGFSGILKAPFATPGGSRQPPRRVRPGILGKSRLLYPTQVCMARHSTEPTLSEHRTAFVRFMMRAARRHPMIASGRRKESVGGSLEAARGTVPISLRSEVDAAVRGVGQLQRV